MYFLHSRFLARTLLSLTLLAAGFSAAIAAQPPEISFSSLLQSVSFSPNATNSTVLQAASVCDAAGNVYVTGSFEGTITVGTNVLSNSGGFPNDDVYVVKYDPAGNVIWIRRAGGSGKDYGKAIALDGAGGVYVSGISDSFPFIIGTNSLNNINAGMFLAHYDSGGNVLWAQWGGNQSVFGSAFLAITGLTRDPAGNPIVAGSFRGSPTIGTGTGAIVLTNKTPAPLANGEDDLLLAKFSTTGALLWATNYGGTNSEVANSVAIDSTGAIYVTGTYQTSTVFGAQTYTNLTEGILFLKFAGDGSLIWSSNVSDATNSNPGRGWSVVVDSANRVTLSFQGDNASKPFFYHGTNYALAFGNINLLAQFDTNGNLLWIKQTLFNGAQSFLTLDKSDNIYLGSAGGLTNGTVLPGSLSVFKADFNSQPIWTNHVIRSATGLSLPSVSVDDSYVTHVSTTLGTATPLTVGWTNLTFPLGGQYQLVFTIASNYVSVPPFFVQQPTNLVFQPPAGFTNQAQAHAWPAPTYYWYQNNVRITNSTNFLLTISPTTFTNRTAYFVVASNVFGMATSAVFNAQAGIAFVTQPPTNISVLIGTTLNVSATVTGTTAIAYQWRFNGTNIANATGSTLAVTNIATNQAGSYTLVISNAAGSLTSAPPTLVTVLPYGSVDPTWTNGLAVYVGGIVDVARSSDGSFYVANGQNACHVFANGQLDTNGFINLVAAGSGLVAYHFNDGSPGDVNLGPTVVKREPDGKILVAGTFKVFYPTPATVTNVNRMARFNTNGTLDTNFNVGLGATNSVDGQNFSRVESVVRLTNGQYLVAGTFNRFNGQLRTNLVRLNNDGSLDTNFPAHTSKLSVSGSSIGMVHEIAVQADGKILIAGEFDIFDGVANHCLTRLNADGTVDNTFVQTDIAANPFARANTVLPLPDGSILLAGSWSNLTNTGIVRFTTNGVRDTNWQGKMPGEAYSVSLLPNNKLIIGGNSYVRRTTYDGVNDAVFNPGAFFTSQLTYAIAPEPSGNVVVGGSPYGLRRLLLEPAPVVLPTFGGGSGLVFANGQFQFSACGGVDGQTIIVQASTNLVNWINVSTNLVSGGCISYADLQPAALPNRYYRLATGP